MKFSIVTPTLQRESLVRCCESVDAQSLKDGWEHIVMVDCEEIDKDIFAKIDHPQRWVYQCEKPHRNYGNTCRHNAWEKATGTYLVMLDDDNVLNGPFALASIAEHLETAGYPDWAIFPIVRHGWYFFNDPPGLCMTDTLNAVVKREIGRWPDIPDYTADGHWVEALKAKYPYVAFPNTQPIGIMERSNQGK